MPSICSKKLAVFGGEPAFAEQLHVGRPNIGNREAFLRRVNDLLDRRWLTNDGRYVRELEERLSSFLNVRNVVLVANGTLALEITARAMEIGGEVIVPSFTFVATPHALQWQEITPVFCDVAPGTHHLDPARISEMVTPRTSAILAVHVWGAPCDVEGLQKVADAHDLKLIFDAAHALGCSYRGEMIGGFGSAEVFSFHATKFFNTFEGGAIATNDDDLADRMRYTRNFGFAGYDDVAYIGINAKMSEIHAAMGLTSLESMPNVIETNRANYEAYRSALSPLPGVEVFPYDVTEQNNFQYVIVSIDEDVAGLSRDRLVRTLHAENVLARRYFYPGCHEMEPYRSFFPHAGLLLPETNKLTRSVLSLPTGTAVNPEIANGVGALIKQALDASVEINAQMARAT